MPLSIAEVPALTSAAGRDIRPVAGEPESEVLIVGVIVSYSRKFVFVHTSKTAGESITQALMPFVEASDIVIGHPVHSQSESARGLGKHSRVHLIREAMGRDLDDFFKFCFVRNPWDRVVSFYHYQQRMHGERRPFSEFVKVGLPRNSCAKCAMGTDFVGRFERLESDFRRICDGLGIDATLPKLNVSQRRPYREYFDDELRRIVATRYGDDIEAFGYEF